ncbi:MAG TPA: DUF58 domain-containing protein [Polyangiaceae bacterium]
MLTREDGAAMQIHPTRASVDVAIAGMLGVAVAIATRQAAILAWSGALLVGLLIARAVTQIGIARVRSAGFEMLWRGDARLQRAARGELVELEAEIRNRDSRAARYVELRAVHAPAIQVELDPKSGEVPAGGRLRVTLRVSTPRVGRHGIHGLSLEVQGGPGLFEVPLTFANPFGIEVLPQPFAMAMRQARGGRSRLSADAGRPGPQFGDGMELRELREHQPGDPFKRIAWKPSAKRGRLVVREYEREERDVVWLLLDASIELWSGELGRAPLDLAIDQVAAVAQRHLARGDRVGLGILGSRTLGWLLPARGPNHSIKLLSALSHCTDTLDDDRSDLDEADVAARVLEHMRPLDPGASSRLRPSDLDRLARRAERLRPRGPFAGADPHAQSRRERALRRYLSAFGMHSPARLEPDRPKTDLQIAEALSRVERERPRASVVYVWSPPPEADARPEIERTLARYPRRRVDLRWVSMQLEPGIARSSDVVSTAVADAVSLRARAAQRRGELALRRLGIRIEHLKPLHAARFVETAETSPAAKPT